MRVAMFSAKNYMDTTLRSISAFAAGRPLANEIAAPA